MVLISIIKFEKEVRALFVNMGAYQTLLRKVQPFIYSGFLPKGKTPAEAKRDEKKNE